jgi:hypothetical protein
VQREDPSKHPNGLGLLEFDPPLEDDGCVTTTPDSAGGLTGHVDITKVIGDPGPGNSEHVGEQVTIAVLATLQPVDEQGRPVPCDVPGGAPITLQVRRPEGPLVAVLTPVQGSAVAPGRTLTLRATISGGSPFPDDNRNCPGVASDLNPSNNGRGYCVEWSVSGTPSQLAGAGVLTPDDLPGTDADGKVIAEADYQVPTNTVGNVVFTVGARDSSGNQAISAAPVVVRSAKPLAFAEAASEQSVVAPGETVTLTATGTGGEAPYRIDYKLDTGTLGTLSSAGCPSRRSAQACTVDYTAPSNDTKPALIRVSLTDAVDATVSTTIPLTVSSREALVISGVFVNPVPNPNATTLIRATVEGGTPPFTVCFGVNAGGVGGSLDGGASAGCGPIDTLTNCVCTPNAPPVTVERTYRAPANAGADSVTAKVRDNVGAIATSVASVNVSSFGGGGGGGGGGTVSLSVNVADPDLCANGAESTTITATATGGSGVNTFTFTITGAPLVGEQLSSASNVATYRAPTVGGTQTIQVKVTETGGSTAVANVAISSLALTTCDDGNACTDNVCASGACSNPPKANGTGCNDGLFCTGADTCAGGACTTHAGTPCGGASPQCNETTDACVECLSEADCNDGNDCTTDMCDAGGSCVHTSNSATCNDGLFCNGADTCGGGTCSVHAGTPCGAQACDEATDACVDCLNNAQCGDGSVCTNDVCAGGACTHPPVGNGTVCNDGLFCTATDVCTAGVCGGTGDPCVAPQLCNENTNACVQCLTSADCNDGNGCTTDACVANVCVNTPNNIACNDGLFCNGADTCASGTCSVHVGSPCGGGTPQCSEPTDACVECLTASDCNDGNGCTTDTCVAGACVFTNNTIACNDGVFCNGADTCGGGTCSLHTGDPCVLPELCSEGTDACVECLSAANCDDGNGCTTDACVGNVCVNTPNNVACNDGLFCNGADTCGGGTCSVHAGSPCPALCNEGSDACVTCLVNGDCNDGNVCTTDTCVAGACAFTNNAAACEDSVFCNGGDTCGGGTCSVHAGSPCGAQACKESTDTCVECLTNGNCAGGTPFCNTTTNLCVECLASVHCNDANVCTTDVCDAGGSCVNFANSLACNDGLFCNGADTCSGGVCSIHAGDPCPGLDVCDEGGDACVTCVNNGDCGGATPFCETGVHVCVECLNAGHCNDAVGCTDDTCVANACVFTPNNLNCPEDGVFCNGVEFCDAALNCESPGDPCGGATPVCDEGGDRCVACLVNGDCGGATPFCETGTHLCVECLIDGDCDLPDTCNPITHVCE